MFSILFPTRERLPLLESLLASIATNTSGAVEVLAAVDDDDRITLPALARLRKQYLFARFVVGQRQTNFSEGYYNRMAREASGDYLIACNDDCEFMTPGWDKIARDLLEEYLSDKPDRICYGWVEDDLPNRPAGYSCFPLLTKEAVKALGWYFPPTITTWRADFYLWEIFKMAQRICDLSAIRIAHKCFHNGTRERDNVSHRVERLCKDGVTWWDSEKTIQKIIACTNP